VGDRNPPAPLEGRNASREALGQLPRKAISSWAGIELLAKWVDTRKKQTQAQTTRQTRTLSVASTQLSRVQRPGIPGWIRDKSRRLYEDQFSRFTII
jgi:hypothetical protein